MECPWQPRPEEPCSTTQPQLKLRETKSGVMSVGTVLDQLETCTSTENMDKRAAHLFLLQYTATLLAFIILYQAQRFTTPWEWLYLQLNGGAKFIDSKYCSSIFFLFFF